MFIQQVKKKESWCFIYLLHRKLTSLLISSCLSGAERAVALIMVDVWLSVSFLMQRCPATMLHTLKKKKTAVQLINPAR